MFAEWYADNKGWHERLFAVGTVHLFTVAKHHPWGREETRSLAYAPAPPHIVQVKLEQPNLENKAECPRYSDTPCAPQVERCEARVRKATGKQALAPLSEALAPQERARSAGSEQPGSSHRSCFRGVCLGAGRRSNSDEV